MGTELNLSGFGNFILRNKKSRIGRNPNTKEEFPIPARRVVSFHTSPKLRKFLKNN
jgi:integration host factor subunit alpha